MSEEKQSNEQPETGLNSETMLISTLSAMHDDPMRAKLLIYDLYAKLWEIFLNIPADKMEGMVRATLGFCSQLEQYEADDVAFFLSCIGTETDARNVSLEEIWYTILYYQIRICQEEGPQSCDQLNKDLSDHCLLLISQLKESSILVYDHPDAIEDLSYEMDRIFGGWRQRNI